MIDDTTPAEGAAYDEATSRRSLLGKGAAVAAVAAVAGLSSQKARAANGDTMVVGFTQSGTNTTKLTGGTTFWVEDGTSGGGGASLYGSQGSTSTGTYGVRGRHDGSQGTGVYGEANGSSGLGVYGKSTGSQGIAVYGEHLGDTRSGEGVRGQSDNGPGVVGNGTQYDVQADGSGRLGLTKAGNTGSPTDSGTVGTIARDSAGNLWYCYATGKWQRLGGPNAAGTFHPIAPIRAYDSRRAATPNSGVFAASSSRVISVKDGRDAVTGTVTQANAVPAGATAVAFNVTATGTTAPSFLAVVPGNVAATSVSTLNWSAGGTSIANSSIVGLNASRQVRVIAGPGGQFHCIIDISGYYI